MTMNVRPKDAELRERVLADLRWDPRVQDTPLGVNVTEGVVTLTGVVHGYSTRLAAQEAAHRVHGVCDVVNDIIVEIPPGRGTDFDIASAVRRMLEWDARVPAERLTSTVDNGCVVLEGTVENWSEREDAERVVANIMGVQAVVNRIHVTPPRHVGHPARGHPARARTSCRAARPAHRRHRRPRSGHFVGAGGLAGRAPGAGRRRAYHAGRP
jgi:osmotically-inducible protein OsmY